MLQKATYEFIDIKKQDRVSWHSIEYIYSYYTKYLWRRNHEYDFEGEILDYLNRQGEATTRMFLQRLRAEMLKIITFYSKWNEFYDSYTQQDLFKLAYMSSKTEIERYSAGASMHLKDCSEHIKKLEYDDEKLVYSNLQRMLEALSQCHKRYLDSVEEYYDSLTKKIKETEELTSIARVILFDYLIYRFGELLDDVRRSSWTDDFLDTLHLDKNSYGKKYKEVESGDSKSKAKEFAEAVNRIIRKYKS